MYDLKPQARAGQTLNPSTSKAPEPLSPVANLLDTLAAQLSCAQENMTLLYTKLEPVRAIM